MNTLKSSREIEIAFVIRWCWLAAWPSLQRSQDWGDSWLVYVSGIYINIRWLIIIFSYEFKFIFEWHSVVRFFLVSFLIKKCSIEIHIIFLTVHHISIMIFVKIIHFFRYVNKCTRIHKIMKKKFNQQCVCVYIMKKRIPKGPLTTCTAIRQWKDI